MALFYKTHFCITNLKTPKDYSFRLQVCSLKVYLNDSLVKLYLPSNTKTLHLFFFHFNWFPIGKEVPVTNIKIFPSSSLTIKWWAIHKTVENIRMYYLKKFLGDHVWTFCLFSNKKNHFLIYQLYKFRISCTIKHFLRVMRHDQVIFPDNYSIL